MVRHQSRHSIELSLVWYLLNIIIYTKIQLIYIFSSEQTKCQHTFIFVESCPLSWRIIAKICNDIRKWKFQIRTLVDHWKLSIQGTLSFPRSRPLIKGIAKKSCQSWGILSICCGGSKEDQNDKKSLPLHLLLFDTHLCKRWTMHKRSRTIVRKAATSTILRHFTIFRNLSTTERTAKSLLEILRQ